MKNWRARILDSLLASALLGWSAGLICYGYLHWSAAPLPAVVVCVAIIGVHVWLAREALRRS